MKLAHWSLFIAGLFFGGVVDHIILGVVKSPLTPYGINLGIYGNWWMALFDLALTGLFFWPYLRHLKRKETI